MDETAMVQEPNGHSLVLTPTGVSGQWSINTAAGRACITRHSKNDYEIATAFQTDGTDSQFASWYVRRGTLEDALDRLAEKVAEAMRDRHIAAGADYQAWLDGSRKVRRRSGWIWNLAVLLALALVLLIGWIVVR